MNDSNVQKARPMDTAPCDGTMVRLLVQFDDHATEDTEGPAWTIGACNDDNMGDAERVGWQFAGWCWTHDHFNEGKGTPVGWLPMIDASPKGGGTDAEPKIWGTQKPGSMPKLFGAHYIAELNWYPDEGHDLVCMQVIERVQATSGSTGVDRD